MPARRKPAGPAIERLSGLASARDRHEAVEVFARAFANPAWMEDHVERSLLRTPIYDPEHTRVVVADGRVVAAVVMGPRDIRFGPVTVPAMTVGPLGTHDKYRRRGFAVAAMDDASRYMAENGVFVAYLQGMPDFYYRFGYYPFMAPSRVMVKRRDARKEARPGKLRAMRRKDLPAIRRFYEEATAERLCAAARDDRVWDWLLGPGKRSWQFRNPKVIVDAQGRACGYVTEGRGEGPSLGEVVVRGDEASCRAALGALAAEARRREHREIGLPLAWDDPLAAFIRQHVPAEHKTWTNPTGGALLKVVDFPALMKALEPLFDRRWRATPLKLRPAKFVLATEIGRVGLAVSGRGVRVGKPAGERTVRVPQRWLSGLLTGYYPVAEVAARKGARIPDDLRRTMDVLFPTGWPFVYQGDNY